MKEYEVEIGGLTHTVLLDDDEAKRLGSAAKPVEAKSAPAPKNKARSASDKKG